MVCAYDLKTDLAIIENYSRPNVVDHWLRICKQHALNVKYVAHASLYLPYWIDFFFLFTDCVHRLFILYIRTISTCPLWFGVMRSWRFFFFYFFCYGCVCWVCSTEVTCTQYMRPMILTCCIRLDRDDDQEFSWHRICVTSRSFANWVRWRARAHPFKKVICKQWNDDGV